MRTRPFLSIATLGWIALAGACATTSTVANRELIVYPPPPDTARIQFLTRISSEADLGGGSSLFSRIVGEETSGQDIDTPYGIGVADGNYFVCDVQTKSIIHVDLQRGDLNRIEPGGVGALRTPINCFVGPDSLLYVTDTDREQVVVYDIEGRFVGTLGDEEGGRPVDVFVDDENIWVSDVRAKTIRVYDRASRTFQRSFPDTLPTAEEALLGPTNLFVTREYVYVSDLLASRVQVFDHDGNWVRQIGRRGVNFGEFSRPKGIAVDHAGRVYVVDAAFENVQVFGPDGRILMVFGGPYRQHGDMLAPAKVVLDYTNLDRFRELVDPAFDLKYLIIVTNQFGPDKISIYGFVGPA